ncbi:Chromatin assembly factor 1 subunit A, putative [Penicillium digitatum]|uniref:Chromatin assembly factor 1 subunit A, putative n=1 Tax=Penicillium digitatum TaxID=36651 RepID=A0A7T7BKM8_PENDI|nr:Chromatin assembly factor 1 subunit A, putative [Penicillium digitatum]
MQSAPSFPAPPSSGPRKRSIHDVDDANLPPPNVKRPLTGFAGRNQENLDPSIPSQPDDTIPPPVEIKRNLPPPPSVEIVMRRTLRKQDEAGTGGLTSAPTNTASNPEPDAPSSKKRKVVSAGTDSKQQEKEAKERQKAEEKAKKEEEKLKKEEEKAKREEERRFKAEEKKKRDAERDEEKRHREDEKRKKDAQREEDRKQRDEKKKAKEDEKAAREEEKRKKDEEKEKKTRSQMKLNSFFTKPPGPSASSGQVIAAPSPKKASITADFARETRAVQSDYEREFPAFFLQSHTVVAPPHRFERDSGALKHVRESIDRCLRNESSIQMHPFRPSEVFQIIPFHRGRQPSSSVRDILFQLNKSEDTPQPTQDQSKMPSQMPQELLRKVTMKSLKFGEDIRPPYQGTFTRRVSELSTRRLARNPYYRGLPDTDYDYDSEAEWEEPEEGEELDSEEEDEGSDEGEDDLEGFLDDEDDALAEGKRRLIVGDLEPVSTGIKWATNGVEPEMEVYRMQPISDAVKFPIDPFSTAYWEKPNPVDQVAAKARPVTAIDGFLVPAVPKPVVTGSGLPPTSKAKRPFPPDQLAEFKDAVEGSDLSKIGLVEILKKRFPKVSKDTLKATLDQVAARVGQKEVDKKWVCR